MRPESVASPQKIDGARHRAAENAARFGCVNLKCSQEPARRRRFPGSRSADLGWRLDHAVEEALCFGWIDSIVKRIDDAKFAQKFTPRRGRTKWSALNQQRLRKLVREGRMTAAGLAMIDPAMRDEEASPKQSQRDSDIPRFVKQTLMKNAKAWQNFQNLAPSRHRAYVRLIVGAKTEETREQRVRDVVSRLTQNTGDPADIPEFIKKALMANAKAWANFPNLAPSYRRHYVGWIMRAAKEETRQQLREAVSLLEQNKKLGLK